MGRDNKKRSFVPIPAGVTKLKDSEGRVGPLSKLEVDSFGLSDQYEGPPYVVLKYYQWQYQCFSEWTQDELRAFSDFIRKLGSMTWADVYKSGSRDVKKGLGYTVHKDTNKLPDAAILKSLSPDITFFELRVSITARVHGFRAKSAFFLLWLDRNHDVYP